ncbi:MAG TPA: hypothetical protein DCZ41_00390 [Firmicutes bacterium]|nr:hypothetical protein [Bacillota bacterium]
MRIGILGSGPSALYTALLIKRRKPDCSIDIFDKEEKLAKKLRATGNGHANVMPKDSFCLRAYNDPSFMTPLLNRYDLPRRIEAFLEMGVFLREKDGLGYYPASDNANQFASFLVTGAEEKGVCFYPGVFIEDYKRKGNAYCFETSIGTKGPYDILLLSPGGKSGKNLGSDGSFVSTLKKHGYKFQDFLPGLCPIYVSDRDLPSLMGIRHDAFLSLWHDEKRFFHERGEILYKNDGLSGIVIMNASSVLARNPGMKNVRVELDLFPDLSLRELEGEIKTIEKERNRDFLDSFLVFPLSKHIWNRAKRIVGMETEASLAVTMKSLSYPYLGNYPFPSSQVSVGGLELHQIEETFESKIEKNVYFAGEILNIDGLCGGYNLLFDLLCAMRISDSL